MWTLPLILLAVTYACILFALGRFFNPDRERLSLRQMDGPAVVHTIVRGWSVLISARSLSRITDLLHRDSPGPQHPL
ncbi:hypothetical protein DFO66_102271 [Brevibacterium sanguinis]|uniref:Uncharacterized protein n=2 Tax=Brevibacterium TaxID=1696 RepID=A0A366IQ46_9MICO|nr:MULTISPECIES: hypothetical protein [Brevibacterium]RBP67218.1 hypothetical protein DFO66_102271 [Brevibacterium sanguinis]RBP73743.1 hypothetical protein DFO65_102271 [Brevibacterium celere]